MNWAASSFTERTSTRATIGSTNGQQDMQGVPACAVQQSVPVLQVVEAAATLVQHMPPDKRKAVLNGILGFITQPMQAALQQNAEDQVVIMADRLTVSSGAWP